MKNQPYLIIILLVSNGLLGQEVKLREFLTIGIANAEKLSSQYTEPITQGLLYSINGGWYNSGVVPDKWEVQLSLVTNGSFVPNGKKNFPVNVEDYDNLNIVGSDGQVSIPTILGSRSSNVQLEATVDDTNFAFDVPTGIGLLPLNILPSAYLQLGVGLPLGTELKLRLFPKVRPNNSEIGVYGVAVQHNISQYFTSLDSKNFSLSSIFAYTGLRGKYNFEASGFVQGSNQSLTLDLDSWLFEFVGSTNNPKWNVYGGIGFLWGNSLASLNGNYSIETETRTLSYTDPFQFTSKASGFRASIGGSMRTGIFTANIDYALQGYNNVSIGLNFKIMGSKKNVQ